MLCIRLEALWNDLPPEADFFALLALQMRFSKGKTVLFNFKTVKIFPCGAGVWTESRGGHLQNDPNQGGPARGGHLPPDPNQGGASPPWPPLQGGPVQTLVDTDLAFPSCNIMLEYRAGQSHPETDLRQHKEQT